MRNKRSAATLIRLLQQARYEVLPTAATEDKVLEHLPRERVVTVTASPGKGLGATLDLAERLTGHGYVVVPHLAARMVTGRTELEEIADRLVGKGISRVFVPGGDADPAGDYPDALALLQDLREIGSPFAHVGITGYPESHPTINDDLTVQSMWDKRHYATHIVSNLTFDPAARPRLDPPAPQPRRGHAAAPRHPGAGRARQAARHGHPHRSGGVDEVPRQEQGPVRPARGTRRLHRRELPGEVRTGPRRGGGPRRGPPRLHLQPDRRDRGLAHRPAPSGCATSYRFGDEVGERLLEPVVAGLHHGERQAEARRRARRPARAAPRRAPGPTRPRACSGRSRCRGARGSGRGPAPGARCGRTTGRGSRSAGRCPAARRRTARAATAPA